MVSVVVITALQAPTIKASGNTISMKINIAVDIGGKEITRGEGWGGVQNNLWNTNHNLSESAIRKLILKQLKSTPKGRSVARK
jgi:hypothetical protein